MSGKSSVILTRSTLLSPRLLLLCTEPLLSRTTLAFSVCPHLPTHRATMIKTSQLEFKTPTERSPFSAAKRIYFLIEDPRPAPSLFHQRFFSLPVVSHQDQLGFGAGSSGGVASSRGNVVASLRGIVDGVGRWLDRGGRGSRHFLPLLLADGTARQP